MNQFCNVLIISVMMFVLASCSASSSTSKYEEVDSVKVAKAVQYCKQHQMDTTLMLFIDMSIHSGKNRFFVWDNLRDTIIMKGLVCHGSGKGSTASTPVFSNEEGSYCTSLGKYKINTRSYSQWGIHIHYKMHGLESTNNNAYKRVVVLHSYDYVPNTPTYPLHIPMGYSLGCPVVSNTFMTQLDALLKNRKQDVLMWIY